MQSEEVAPSASRMRPRNYCVLPRAVPVKGRGVVLPQLGAGSGKGQNVTNIEHVLKEQDGSPIKAADCREFYRAHPFSSTPMGAKDNLVLLDQGACVLLPCGFS